jgi:hypothetical protein
MVMKALTFTKYAVIAGISLLIVAGGAASPLQCGVKSCCLMPESEGNTAYQQAPCGCGCGQFEEPLVPDNSAVMAAISEANPIPTKFDYIFEKENTVTWELIPRFIQREEFPHSPPLKPDIIYKPLLC